MPQQHLVRRDSGRSERLPAFTLGTALAWLGHDCDGSCPPQIIDQRARAWLIHSADGDALVDIEFTAPPWSRERADALMGRVNDCAGRDRIHVRQRAAVAPDAVTLGTAGP